MNTNLQQYIDEPQGHLAFQIKSNQRFVDIPIICSEIEQLNGLIEEHFFETMIDEKITKNFNFIIEEYIVDTNKLYVAKFECLESDFDYLFFACKILANKINLTLLHRFS